MKTSKLCLQSKRKKKSPSINQKIQKKVKNNNISVWVWVILKKVILIKKLHNSCKNSAFRTATSFALISKKFIFISAPNAYLVSKLLDMALIKR